MQFDIPKLFAILESTPGLQRKEWERNQSGPDRGMEAVLIQRAPREVATHALTRIRLAAMPELRAHSEAIRTDGNIVRLTTWARTQGAGGTMLANLIERKKTERTDAVHAAIARLAYYYCRDEHNPTVKSAWTAASLKQLTTVDAHPFLESPTRGKVWERKFETIRRLATHVQLPSFADLSDDGMVGSLKSVPRIGEQTASMVALFWFERPVPIIDTYLVRLVQDHQLLPPTFARNTRGRATLRSELIRGAESIAAHRPQWPAARILSCLYLWICEVGRLHCRCRSGDSSTCPIAAST